LDDPPETFVVIGFSPNKNKQLMAIALVGSGHRSE